MTSAGSTSASPGAVARPQGGPAGRWSGGSGRRRLAGALGVGLLAGFLSGVFGVGGGILLVPGLVLLLHLAEHRAHGTSLGAIIPIAAAAVLGYAVHGSVDVPAAVLLTAGSALGAIVGTWLLLRLPGRALRLGFAALMFATAVRLFFSSRPPPGSHPLTVSVAAALVGIGLGTGVLAGLLGVGGGIVMVPALVLLVGASDVVSKGTSLLVIIPTALVGTARNAREGNVDLPVAAIAGLAGVLSAYAGSVLAVHLDPRLSRLLFGLLLVVAAGQLVLTRRADR